MIFSIFIEVSLIFCAYLLGSASSAILLCRLAYDVDIRDLGSKNPGANNVQRIFGWKMGFMVFIIDFLKGMGAVSLAYLMPVTPGTELFVTLEILLGAAAMLGHIFPLFFKFKGGKGVSVLTGTLTTIHPMATLICVAVFLIMIFFTKYMSLSVLVAVTFYPIMINSVFGLWLIPDETITLRIFSVVIALALWLTHIPNIRRLINHQEDKFSFHTPISYKNSR